MYATIVLVWCQVVGVIEVAYLASPTVYVGRFEV